MFERFQNGKIFITEWNEGRCWDKKDWGVFSEESKISERVDDIRVQPYSAVREQENLNRGDRWVGSRDEDCCGAELLIIAVMVIESVKDLSCS